MARPTAFFLRDELSEDGEGVLYQHIYRVRPATSAAEAKTAEGLPEWGKQHPAGPGTVVTNIQAGYVEESGDVYEVTVEGRTIQILPPEFGEEGPAAVGKAGFDAPNQVVQAWRTDGLGELGLRFPADPSAPGAGADHDIGGVPFDTAGEPSDLPLTPLIIQVPVRYDQGVPLGVLQNYRLKRNSRAFGVFGPHTVLFKTWRLSIPLDGASPSEGHLEFVYDDWYHLRQRALYDTDKQIIPWGADDPETETHPDWIGRARTVNWYQPFPRTADLSYLLRVRT